MTRLLPLALAAFVGLASAAHAAFETRATAAWIYDQTTGTVLLEKNAHQPLPPASMSKLMTLNMLFEALRDGRVTLDTRFSVSSRARAMGGSTMFLDETDRPTVESLIKGIIVQSGNDACVVVAEGLAGTEEAFARLMNERARVIGLTDSNFVNSSGWPHPDHRMSMADLGKLSVRLIEEFPDYYQYFALQEYEFDGRAPSNTRNRNPILGLGIGADGLKTGHTEEAGYGLAGSAVQGERRVVFVISGLDSRAARAEESERIISWAFRQFVERTVAEKGTRLAEVPVHLGAERSVGMIVPDDVSLLVPALVQDRLEAEISYEAPLVAPIRAGQQIGTLRIDLPELGLRELPLTAASDVAVGGFLPRLRTAAEVLLRDIAGRASPL
ncbi:MAG: D-alanyl-D-alanine carboxypeptidase family protein [Paracoccaceae bacterium]|jgi:D-alanyl-D-alanine carboxypeptidase (penicillin-binding protein 5/6)|nr:D-alanyl-D-alanine carboxypeptidase family protein [Paracoccaceae bacterium]